MLVAERPNVRICLKAIYWRCPPASLLSEVKRAFRELMSVHNSLLNRIDTVLPGDCDLAANRFSCQLDHPFAGLKFELSCVELTN